MTSVRLVYVLSPAKTLDFTATRISQCTQPRLLSHAHELIEQLRTLSQPKVKSLLGVSDALAKLNFDRYQGFDTSKTAVEASKPSQTLKQAALAFHGPAYQGLEASNLSGQDLEFAQTHLCILCGLYGLLRPLDLIQPYRLEMGQLVPTSKGKKSLYEFWGDSIVHELALIFRHNEATDTVKKQRVLVNVASQEYVKVLPRSALKVAGISVVNCVFQDDGQIKSVYAKRARGLMCRYLVQNRVDTLKGLMGFQLEGYKYSSTASSDDTFVFSRPAVKQKLRLQTTKATQKSTLKAKRGADWGVENRMSSQSTVEVNLKNDQDGPPLRRSTRKKRKTN